ERAVQRQEEEDEQDERRDVDPVAQGRAEFLDGEVGDVYVDKAGRPTRPGIKVRVTSRKVGPRDS
ncbi:MAG TPA: hypothetical protein VKV73_03460, partial [Chloroflexota bacterium]|nr:hypothetical protein [Chloroflexota bacterium]